MNRQELATGLAHFLPRSERSSAPVIAGTTLVALDVAIDNWQRAKGKRSLAVCITEAFDHLTSLSTM